MGYRSDVAAVFYAKNIEDMPVIKLWLEENFPIDTFAQSIRWFAKGMVFNEENVKWYDNYPEVMAFEEARDKFIDLFCDDKEGAVVGAFEFIRVGEQYDDVETDYRGDYDCLLECNRSISVSA
jgi:hypothetical protein